MQATLFQFVTDASAILHRKSNGTLHEQGKGGFLKNELYFVLVRGVFPRRTGARKRTHFQHHGSPDQQPMTLLGRHIPLYRNTLTPKELNNNTFLGHQPPPDKPRTFHAVSKKRYRCASPAYIPSLPTHGSLKLSKPARRVAWNLTGSFLAALGTPGPT